MEERMKNRRTLLGILFIAGLLIAGLFIVFGVTVRTVVTSSQGVNVSIDGDKGSIYKDGKVLHTFTLPPSYFEGDEDYEYSWNSPNISEGGIRLGKKVIKNIEISEARVNELI